MGQISKAADAHATVFLCTQIVSYHSAVVRILSGGILLNRSCATWLTGASRQTLFAIDREQPCLEIRFLPIKPSRMESGDNTHYVSFLDDNMRAEADDGVAGSASDHQVAADQRPGAESSSLRHGSASVFRKLLQSHRYKARFAAAVGFLAVILFAASFLYLRSVDNSENELFPNGWTPPDVRRRAAGSDVDDSSVWNIAGDPFNAWNWTDEQFEGAFAMWAQEHKKSYASAEERAQRFRVFRKNVIYIAAHNAQGFSYKLKINEFADLTIDEFRARHLGYRKSEKLGERKEDIAQDLLAVNEKDLPSSFDWREKGCVREVKDQGQCGSCWAFAATGALEGAACAQTGRKVDLSEQQLMDCSGPEGNMGCNGGEMDFAFKFVIDNHGLCAEKDYPYEVHEDKCRHSCKPVVHVQAYKDVPRKSEAALKAAIIQHGPVAVGINADQLPFQFYHEGVFDASCGTTLDHGVLVVGYGNDSASGKDYWIVKNSWGPSWGDHGYIKMAQHVGANGECGILLGPSFPLVAKEGTVDETAKQQVSA